MIRHCLALIACLTLTPLSVRADPAATPSPTSDPCLQLGNLVARPTVSTSACTVPVHALLVQTGYTNITTSGASANGNVNYPQTNLGVGIAPGIEFDLNPPSIERVSGSAPARGDSDGAIGAKFLIGKTSKFVYGLNTLYTLPVGDEAFSSSGEGILINLNGNFALSPAVGVYASLGYNAQSAGTPSSLSRYHDVQPSLGASLALPQNATLFFEGFNQSSTAPGTGGTFGVDTGFQKDVGSRVQLDAEYFDYLTIHGGAHQHAVGFGAAYLIGPL